MHLLIKILSCKISSYLSWISKSEWWQLLLSASDCLYPLLHFPQSWWAGISFSRDEWFIFITLTLPPRLTSSQRQLIESGLSLQSISSLSLCKFNTTVITQAQCFLLGRSAFTRSHDSREQLQTWIIASLPSLCRRFLIFLLQRTSVCFYLHSNSAELDSRVLFYYTDLCVSVLVHNNETSWEQFHRFDCMSAAPVLEKQGIFCLLNAWFNAHMLSKQQGFALWAFPKTE